MRINEQKTAFEWELKFYKKLITEGAGAMQPAENMQKAIGMISFAESLEIITAEEKDKYTNEIIELTMQSKN